MARTGHVKAGQAKGGIARTRGRRVAMGVAALVAAAAPVLGTAPPAGACGGLVGENGTIELVRTTTLAAYHDGVERYVTSFDFVGQGESVGSIVPLPGVPTEVERGGDWTLQRLAREVAPPPDGERADRFESVGQAISATVLYETEIDALDITILEGGGDEVGRWALENGFLLTPDAPEVLDFYARRSPIFMAARFDASRAAAQGLQEGDGTPIMLTIPTDDPWVPLRILGLGLDDDRQVQADVFLLTPERPGLRTGGDGVRLERSERASDLLLDDLRGDAGMGWVPDDLWLSYLKVDAPAGALDYDLAVSAAGGVPDVDDLGGAEPQRVSASSSATAPGWVGVRVVFVGALLLPAVLAVAYTAVGAGRSVRRQLAGEQDGPDDLMPIGGPVPHTTRRAPRHVAARSDLWW